MIEPTSIPQSPDDRATAFQAVQGPQAEHYSGEVLLVSAYAILWVILVSYIGLVWRKQSVMNARIAELEKVLQKAATARGAT